MSKYHKIRWKQSDLDELARVVRNYNAKVRRLEKNPQIEKALPKYYNSKLDSYTNRITVGQLKEIINTRQDLKREINSLKRFSKRGSESLVTIPDNDYNLEITKWQRNEMSRRTAVINRRRKKRLEEIKNFEMSSRGEALGYTREQLGMGKVEEIALSPMKSFTKSMDRRDLLEKWRSIFTQSQSDYFTKKDYEVKENYLKGIRENYNFENVKDIYKHIEKMDIKEFFKVFQEEGGTFEIASPDGQLDLKHEEYLSYESALRSTWLPNK